MVLRVQKIGENYCILLTPQAMEALNLADGAEIELQPLQGTAAEPNPDPRRMTYASVEEGLAAYRRTEPLHRNTYRELAK